MTPLIFSQFGFQTLTLVDYISLIAATTNAFNGALLARRPDHYRHFTVIGVIVLAYAGGIGGGIVRDVLVNKVPSPLINPWYLILCLSAALDRDHDRLRQRAEIQRRALSVHDGLLAAVVRDRRRAGGARRPISDTSRR